MKTKDKKELLIYLLKNDKNFKSFLDIEIVSEGISSNVYRIKDNQTRTLILKTSVLNDISSKKLILNQYKTQRYLYEKFPVPEPVYYCLDSPHFDFPFYIMKDIKGVEKNNDDSIFLIFETMMKLHEVPLDNDLRKKIKGKNSILNEIKKIKNQYENTCHSEALSLNHIFNWMIENFPKDNINTITHNDYKIDNVLFNNEKVAAVLDWELSDIGDPRVDFGIFISYIPEDKNDIKNLMIKDFIKKYDIKNNHWKFFEVFGIVRLITIMQLAYIRYNNNVIQGKKYENIQNMINIEIQKCERIIGI